VDAPINSYEDLSSVNVLVLQEPNEYFNLHNWAIANHNSFSLILTWDDKVLNNCPNAVFFPFGNLWMDEEIYSKKRDKQFKISHLQGKKLLSTREAAEGKEFIYGDSMFGVVIENTSHRGYFTEKILDSFALKTIPLYWGCTSISDFFNSDGIIRFENVDDLIHIVNNLTEDDYYNRLEAIEDNYLRATTFGDYEIRIADEIKEVFKYNNLI